MNISENFNYPNAKVARDLVRQGIDKSHSEELEKAFKEIIIAIGEGHTSCTIIKCPCYIRQYLNLSGYIVRYAGCDKWIISWEQKR